MQLNRDTFCSRAEVAPVQCRRGLKEIGKRFPTSSKPGSQLGDPWGLDTYPFQQMSKCAIFAVPSLYHEGRFPKMKKA